MTARNSKIHPPSVLEHDLNQHFPELLKFESLAEAEKSAVYEKIRPQVNEILSSVVVENYSAEIVKSSAAGEDQPITAVAWNIERGRIFEGILDALKNHDQLRSKELYLLTELDYGMIRSGNRFIAQEIAGANLNLKVKTGNRSMDFRSFHVSR